VARAATAPRTDEPRLRPGRDEDGGAVAALLYETATGMYDGYLGGRDAALRILRSAYARRGTSASREVVTVASIGDEVVGAIAVFPVAESSRRARRFLRVMLARSAPWHWPAILRVFRLAGDATPPAPRDALYIDAIATAPAHRRAGVATALLDAAAFEARRRGLGSVALDAAVQNFPARSLYERLGFEVSEKRAPIDRLPGIVGYVRRV
jgi:ribosomal protein S18 acetylase RimI-like enzyme